MESIKETEGCERGATEQLVVKRRHIVAKVKPDVEYYYVNKDQLGIVWRNVAIFTVLHLFYFCGWYLIVKKSLLDVLVFQVLYAIVGGLSVTAGAHRLWSHRAYQARLPLRVFLMLTNCIAIQNDIIEWCRDHRLHHKSSETDADPHNSNRGWFFAHMGWLMQKKHPKVIDTGKKLDLSDLYNDPVLVFQKRNYWPMAVAIGFGVPTAIACWYFGLSLWDSLCISIWRYVSTLHSTWFINSAAHIWGEKEYDERIEPREAHYMSFCALGEGFHNYHHTFPYDYAASEHGKYYNLTTAFIDLMSFLGLAHSLKKVDPDVIKQRRMRTGKQEIRPVTDVVKYLL